MTRLAIPFLIVILALCAGTLAAEKPLAMSIHGWGKVVDPDGDSQIDLDGTKVKITVPGSPHDFAAELQQWNAPRILRGVRGDFIAEVKISGTFDPKGESTIEGRKPYNGAGLLVIADNDNHVSLQRAAFWTGDHVRHYLNFEYRHDGKTATARFGMNIDDADCWLRLQRRGTQMIAMISTDGVNWKSYEPIEVGLPNKLKIGVEAVTSAKDPFECSFEGYSLFVSGRDSADAKAKETQGIDDRAHSNTN